MHLPTSERPGVKRTRSLLFGASAEDRTWSVTSPMMLFVLAHVPLGLLLNSYSILTFAHAAITLLVGLRWAATSDRPVRVAGVAAYITGAEVLWRMTTDRLPWELGKYAVIAVCGAAIVRHRGLRGLAVPLLFFSLLLPSVALTLGDFSLEEARQQISFNLSGPLAIVICAGFFHNIKLSFAQLQRVLLCLIAPVTGIAAIVLLGIVTTPDITFNTESNFATSGGFGPNQVSAILGLGTLCAFFSLFAAKASWQFRLTIFAILTWLGAQSALTFSRGGLFAAGGAAAVALLYLVRDPRLRLRLALVAVLVLVVAKYVVWPRLDEFTGGMITARFTESDLTHRDELGWADLNTWDENPILGVGPGRSSLEHARGVIAHTEFTRLLAEHGSLGAASIALMLVMSYLNLRNAGSDRAKGLVLAMMAWTCLFMMNSAMRVAAPSFLFGLSFAGIGPPSPAVAARVARAVVRRRAAPPHRRLLART